MTSSSLEIPANTPGAHRGQHRAPHSSPKQPPARYEPHLDGLFTYCLSVLCDHDAATEALGGVLALAERQGGRCPADEEERRTWLYALARWTCLRRLTEQKQGRRAHRRPDTARPHRRPADEDRHAPAARRPRRTAHTTVSLESPVGSPAGSAVGTSAEGPAAEAHRRELAQLAWPEAAGTTPEQREALELAVRHGLTPRAVAAVLGLDATSARELLAGAACEVERTRAALAVVEKGNCPTAGRLTGDHRALLSPTLRRELVRHVDDCPRCRRAAERAGAEGPWPGKAVTPAAVLPVVEAPRPSAYVAMLHAQKHQKNRSATPRFDRTGFPMDPKDHAARRDRLRSRVMTTTVVATVVAAPVIALWSAYRGAPLTGEGRDGSAVSAADNDTGADETPYDRYENAGNARPDAGSRFTDGDTPPEVSAEIISPGAGPATDPAGHGRLTVEARTSGSTTLVTLTASKAGPVSWSAAADRSWVRLSRTSGKLPAGGSVTIRALVDHAREPAGPWTAHLTLAPSGAVVALHGYGAKAPTPGASPRPGHPPRGSLHPHRPVPADPTPTPPEPTPDPSEPTPDPTPTPTPTETEPSPTPDPAGSSEPPAPPKGPSTPPRAD
ncbi:hypothetical protein ACIOEZ_27090 [Streptomyces sp. NPDC087866]|uniref:hypothetical protein n=1 Tax=unclassified Streptomyces TaxID=2593676 RepID=UPI00224F7782|nr:hypothetical protein [Streptomyces sp. NBC_01789]MCX4448491.1 hypothetical protein [Streptomyces sp. NBC_01789]